MPYTQIKSSDDKSESKKKFFKENKQKLILDACEQGNLTRIIHIINYGEEIGELIDIHYNDDEIYKTLCHYRDIFKEDYVVDDQNNNLNESDNYEKIIDWIKNYAERIYSPIKI